MPEQTTARCPHCQSRLRLGKAAAGKAVACPKCGMDFTPESATVECAKCKGPLPPGSVFCVHCGYDMRSRTKTQTVFIAAKKTKPKSEKEPPRTSANAPDWGEITWEDILRAPLQAEFVIGETVSLTLWILLWEMLLLSIVAAILFLGVGPFAIFTVSAYIAGIIRYWMVVSDVGIKTVLMTAAGLGAVSMALGYGVNAANPMADPMLFAILIFVGLILIAIALRAISFVFGKYFAILRRAALNKLTSGEGRDGYRDLFDALAIGIPAFLPWLAVGLAAGIVEAKKIEIPGGIWLFLGLGAAALLWAYFYFTMGIATVALRGRAGPGGVLGWIFAILPEYLTLLLIMLPVHVGVWVISGAVTWALTQWQELSPGIASMSYFFYAFVVDLAIGQFAIVATLAAMGVLLRRHEERLDWYAAARALD
ncbi:MAG TPA: zinc ribbon domain-containing protein [Planctomycetia bacterium]|nr:zinc ribbon domain-containing protein [Planctomycetia bacterium]